MSDDAMVEIEELNIKYQELGRVLLVARDSIQELDATVVELREQLRAITDAEPVAWQMMIDDGPLAPSALSVDRPKIYAEFTSRYWSRALIVAPKGDTE